MPITAEIGGVPVDIERGSLTIEKRIEERSTASFRVVDEAGVAAYVRGTPIEIFDAGLNTIFAGFIDNPGRARRGATGSVLIHDIACMDNHYLADKRLIVKVYTDKTLEFIVEDIITDYLAAEGVHENVAGDIQVGPTIGTAIFNYVTAAEAFDALKEYSGFTWFIDEEIHIYFMDRATVKAPWNLDMATYKPLKGSVHLSTGNPLYRNRQYIKGGKGITALMAENFTADGVMQSFAVGFPIALEPTITDSVLGAQDVGIKGVDAGEDYYWSKGDNTVYAEVIPVNGRNVEVKYYGQYPLIALASNPAAIAAMAVIDGSTGMVETIATEAEHESAAAMQESAQAKLTTYCRDAEKLIYRTVDVGLAPGQLQEITFSPFGFAAHEMLVESVSISALGELIIYEVTCIIGPSVGSWEKFFSSIITRGDRQLRVGDNYLIVLLLEQNTLEMTESTSLATDLLVDGMAGRWLNTPPIDAGSLCHVRHETMEMTESASETTHATEDYEYDDVTSEYDFATYA